MSAMQAAECLNDPTIGYILASTFPIIAAGIMAVFIIGMVKS